MGKLKKELGLKDVWVISTGAILSSGIFILPGLAYGKSGPVAIFAYIVAALFAMIGVLSQAELATAMPKAGGTYFYITRSMGAAFGTVYGLITFLALSLKSAFELIGMAAFTRLFIDVDIRAIAFILILFFTIVNMISAKIAGKIQYYFVLIVLSGLSFFIFTGFPHIQFARLDPFFNTDLYSFVSTISFIFISYGGLLKVASLGEEVKNPSVNLPLGMILSVLCVIFFYMLTIIVIFGTVDGNILSHTLTPISDSALSFNIPYFQKFMAIIAVLGFSAAANTGIMGASRYPLALSRDHLAPKFMGGVSKKFGTPVTGLIMTAIFMSLSILLEIKVLVKSASCILILTYIFTCLAVIVLRESRVQNYKPSFKSPFYPWLQLAGVLGLSVLLFSLGSLAFITTMILMMAGFLIYFFYGKKRRDRISDHALLHLIARITAKEISSRDLEKELKDIIHQRDEIIKDEFYELCENAVILDLKKSLSHDKFFKIVAKAIGKKINMSYDKVYSMILKRESESSTIITPEVAVPHIVIDGENKFQLLVARCRHGVKFKDSDASVKAVFVLMGTKDQRNIHLKSLAAIAQLIKNSDFMEEWESSKNKESLRDILLLGKRNK